VEATAIQGDASPAASAALLATAVAEALSFTDDSTSSTVSGTPSADGRQQEPAIVSALPSAAAALSALAAVLPTVPAAAQLAAVAAIPSASSVVAAEIDPVVALSTGSWSDSGALAARVAALECIDEEPALEQCMDYQFLYELLGDLQKERISMLRDMHEQLAARDFQGLCSSADMLAGAANNLHLPALVVLSYQLWGLARRGCEPARFWGEDAHLRPLAVALSADQRTRLVERLALAVPPLLTLIEQQFARLESYMPRIARLADEELEWQRSEETCGVLPPVTNVENPPPEFLCAPVSATDH
jgi:HPt (histidine-containing phosphotransfer) domain-containing protein